MLGTQETREIADKLEQYEHKQSAAIDALNIVQRHRGWISDETLRDIADMLEMSTHELDGIATFYNLIYRRPVGRHVIHLCDSVSCWLMGYEQLAEHLRAHRGLAIGDKSADDRFTLLPIPCLGACERAPAMMIDDDLHTGLEPADLDRILERYE